MGERDGRFCLVVNPAAGRGRSLRVLPEVTAVLDAAGASYQVSESASLADAAGIAARAAGMGQVVVAVGGDGLAGALSGVAATGGSRYGIIPAGTGNDLARVLGIPAGPAAAARVLTAGQERQVDLIGVATPGQPETVVACSVYVGIPSVAGQIVNRTRWLRGPIVYSVAALRALAGWAPTAFRVEIRRSDRPEEGGGALVRDFAGDAVVVANAAYFGAGMRVAPPAQLDDGMLDIVTMRHGPRLAFIRTLLRVRNGSHTGLAQISLDRGTEVTVTVGRDLPAAADGETLPFAAPLQPGTPLQIRALPGALRALTPPPPPANPATSAPDPWRLDRSGSVLSANFRTKANQYRSPARQRVLTGRVLRAGGAAGGTAGEAGRRVGRNGEWGGQRRAGRNVSRRASLRRGRPPG